MLCGSRPQSEIQCVLDGSIAKKSVQCPMTIGHKIHAVADRSCPMHVICVTLIYIECGLDVGMIYVIKNLEDNMWGTKYK